MSLRATNTWKTDTNKHVAMAHSLHGTSRSLRDASHDMDKTTRRIQKDTQNQVDMALNEKMESSAQVKSALKHTLNDAEAEISALAADRGNLEACLQQKKQALQLSSERYSLRGTRPSREHTSDTVQNLLCKQQSELSKSIKTINGLIVENENVFKKLTGLKIALEADIKDKDHGLGLDAKALSLTGKEYISVSNNMGSVNVPFRPSNWGRKSQVLIQETQSCVSDAGRLRRRVAQTQKNLATAEATTMKEVQKNLKAKMEQTMDAASQLEHKIKNGYKEISYANKTKESLIDALDHKETPLSLVQQRYHTRHTTRPSREAVHDNVEVALATEYGELNSMVKELSKKHKAVSTQIKHLHTSTSQLEINLRDKSSAYNVDAKCYRMGSNPTTKEQM